MNPTITPLWEKSNPSRERERKKEREKNAVNSGHLVPWQRTQAAQTKIVSDILKLFISHLIYSEMSFFIFSIEPNSSLVP